jgi:hypothetical protein
LFILPKSSREEWKNNNNYSVCLFSPRVWMKERKNIEWILNERTKDITIVFVYSPQEFEWKNNNNYSVCLFSPRVWMNEYWMKERKI